MKFYEKIIGIDSITYTDMEIRFAGGYFSFTKPLSLAKNNEGSVLIFPDDAELKGIEEYKYQGVVGDSYIETDFVNKIITYTNGDIDGLSSLNSTGIRVDRLYRETVNSSIGHVASPFEKIYSTTFYGSLMSLSAASTIGTSVSRFPKIYATELASGTKWSDGTVTTPVYDIPGVNQAYSTNKGSVRIINGSEVATNRTYIAYGKNTTSSSNVDTIITFDVAFATAPHVVITPRSSMGTIAYYVKSVSTTSFVITLGSAFAKDFDGIAIGT